ncbi:MAG: SDR family NAD(P)-dependent oxidoreductase, partial [Thermoanaerobaculia bacterium]
SRSVFAESVRDELGQVDVLVVSSGAAPLRRFAETSDGEWLTAIETNLIGVNQTVSALIDLLAPGSITLAISSESVDDPRSHLGAYGASKAALEHLSRTLAVELEGTGVRVEIVDPGEMATQMHRDAIDGGDVSHLPPPESVAPRIVSLIDSAMGKAA